MTDFASIPASLLLQARHGLGDGVFFDERVG